MDFDITVARSEFLTAVGTAAKIVKKKESGQAVLSCEDQILLVDFPGGQVGMPVSGVWKGQVRISLAWLLAYARTMPEVESLRIWAEAGRIHFGPNSISCVILPLAVKYPTLPLDAPLWSVLALRVDHSDATLEAAGLLARVQQAEQDRDVLIKKAARLLSPLGIGAVRLHKVVQENVTRRAHE